MRLRVLFVTGLTIGVMALLVWVAYSPNFALNLQPKQLSKPLQTNGQSAPSFENRKVGDIASTAIISPVPEAMASTAPHAEKTQAPHVVDLYVGGAHIITVCSALTPQQKLRAGCP